jgi:hypothetical protein
MAAKRAKSPAVVAVPPAAPVVKADAPQPTKAEQVIEASVLWEKDHLTYSTVTIRLRYDTKVAADELRNILRVLSENGNI